MGIQRAINQTKQETADYSGNKGNPTVASAPEAKSHYIMAVINNGNMHSVQVCSLPAQWEIQAHRV